MAEGRFFGSDRIRRLFRTGPRILETEEDESLVTTSSCNCVVFRVLIGAKGSNPCERER